MKCAEGGNREGKLGVVVFYFFVHFLCVCRFSELYLFSTLLSRDVLGVVRRCQRLLRDLVVLGAAEEHDLYVFY